MKKLMIAVAAFAALLVQSAKADTIAYWHNDLKVGSAKGGWTISDTGSATFADGVATLQKATANSPAGLKLDLIGAPVQLTAATIIIKYSNLDSTTSNNAVIEALCGTADEEHRWLLYANGQNKNLVAGYDGNQPTASNRPMQSEGMIALCMDGNKVRLFTQDETGAFQRGNGQYSVGHNLFLRGIRVGGSQESTTRYHRPGMTIEGIAILDRAIDNNFTYTFPDETLDYPKHTVSDYIVKDATKVLLQNATLADLLDAKITGMMNGNRITEEYKDLVLPVKQLQGVYEEETLTKVTMQFHLKESSYVKAVLAECTQDGDNVVIKALGAKYSDDLSKYGEDASDWANNELATSANSTGYGIHSVSIWEPYAEIVTIHESTTWAEAGIETPAEGEKTRVYVDGGATVTFADGDNLTGIDLVSKTAAGGISVCGRVSSLPTTETLTVPAAGACVFADAIDNSIIAKGVVEFVGKINTDYLMPIELAGGTLKVSGSNTTSYRRQFHRLTYTADSKIDAAVNFFAISDNYYEFNYGLNGHKLTKTGSGTYLLRTPNLVGGGAIDVQDGAMTLQDAKLVEGATLDVSVASGKTLKFTGSVANLVGTINLISGQFTASGDSLNVTVPENHILVRTTSGSDTIYSIGCLPRTEPTTITMKDWTGTAFTYVDGETTRDTTLIEGDKIVIPSTIADDNYWQWHFTDGTDAFAGHEVEINKNMNWKWSVGTMTIGNGATVYVFNTYGLNAGASITGEGTLSVNGVDVPVKGAVTISCTTIAFSSGNFKLTTVGSTLTCAKLEEGETITKVVSGVTGKVVTYDQVTKTYSLEAEVSRPSEIEGGSVQQQEDYDTWAAANGVTGDASINAIAFALNVTLGEGQTVETATKTKLENLLAKIDLAALADGNETKALEALHAEFPNAAFTLVDASIANSTAALFRLKVAFKTAN